jgi:transposase
MLAKRGGNGYRVFKYPRCVFEADRDTVGILSIEKNALDK